MAPQHMLGLQKEIAEDGKTEVWRIRNSMELQAEQETETPTSDSKQTSRMQGLAKAQAPQRSLTISVTDGLGA